MTFMPTFLIALVSIALSDSGFANGTVIAGSFESRALGVSKAYRAYLPDGYAESTIRYPVIYLLHGWGVNEDAWVETLDLPGVADRIDLQAIVVMPDGDRSLYANAVSGTDYDTCIQDQKPEKNTSEKREEFCVRTPRYEDYVVIDLVRYIDSNYRTVASREGRALSGDSSGGFGAISIALRNPTVFSSAASHSGFVALLYDGPYPYKQGQSIFQTEIVPDPANAEVQQILGLDVANWQAHDPYSLIAANRHTDVALYFDCGSEDEYGFDDLAAAFDELLTSLGIEHEFHSVSGHHDDEFFADRIEYSLRFHISQFRKNGVYP